MDYLVILERFGLPITLLFICGWALYKSANWAADKILLPVANRHIQFLDQISVAVEKISDNQDLIVRNQDLLVKNQDMLAQNLTELNNSVRTHSRRMSSLERVAEEKSVN